ncbi:hypothetical protein [Nocardioides sp.]|uniref:hypothetical protein n=1 Tax=Nocardioides sp. TaxID=35761 RepID=UPI003563C59C
MIVAIIVGVVVLVGFGLAWWSSGRAHPLGRRTPAISELQAHSEEEVFAQRSIQGGTPRPNI